MTKTFFPGRFKGKVALFIGVGRVDKEAAVRMLLKVLMWYWLIL